MLVMITMMMIFIYKDHDYHVDDVITRMKAELTQHLHSLTGATWCVGGQCYSNTGCCTLAVGFHLPSFIYFFCLPLLLIIHFNVCVCFTNQDILLSV